MPVTTVCRPLVEEARSGSPRIRAGLYQAHARRSPAVGVESFVRTGRGPVPYAERNVGGEWNSPATFANIRRGPTANLEGEPSALSYGYAACPMRLRNYEQGSARAEGRTFQPVTAGRISSLRSSASPLCAGRRGGRGSRKACQGTRSTQRGCCWSRTSASARSAHPPSRSCRLNPRGQPHPLQWLSLGSFHTS